MRIIEHKIWMQEVPNEISLAICVAGCTVGCKNCHWEELNKLEGRKMNMIDYEYLLSMYKDLVSCVLFMGGDDDTNKEELITFLELAKKYGYRTCLYSGRCGIIEEITEHLDYLKEGPWIESLGGLDSPTTNQRFYRMPEREDLTHLFQKGE
ncbi:MAG: anaerobic ribonucleoside-triphosphate reductase activating protein [Bacteroidia bacterium]|nr:anaerobic ribonucleoside-triphosphate reductase activating protein [Bacteroidia bacterium]